MNFRRLSILTLGLLLAASNALAVDYYTTQTGGTFNWTDNSIWHVGSFSGTIAAPGNYPGSGAGDSANLGGGGYTLNVNAVIPNAVTLVQNCSCAVSIPSGSVLGTTGTSSVASGGSISIAGGTLTNFGTLDFSGSGSGAQLDWSAGILDGAGTTNINKAFTSGARVFANGPSDMYVKSQTVNVSNAFNYVDGLLHVDDAAQIVVKSGGSFDVQNANGIQTNDAANARITVDSGGLFEKTNGNFGTNIDVPLFNDGTVRVDLSTLVVGRGTGTGTFDMNGATTGFEFGQYTFSGSSVSIQGAGDAFFAGPIVVASGAQLAVTNFHDDSGSNTSGGGTITVSGTFNWRGGTYDGVILHAATGSTVNFTGEGNGRLTNNAQMTNDGTMTVAAGAGSMFVDSGSFLRNNTTMTLSGAVTLGSDHLTNARIDNFASGTITKSGSGTAVIDVSLNNAGVLSSTSGDVQFTAGGSSSGTFAVCSACVFDFASSAYSWLGATFNGTTGATLISGATVTIGPGDVTMNTALTQSGGTIGGTAKLTVNNAFTWNGGTQTGAGQTILGNFAHSFTGASAPMQLINNRNLTNNGTITYTPASTNVLDISNGAILQSSGTFNINGDFAITSDGISAELKNLFGGTLSKVAGSGTATIEPALTNAGTLAVTTGVLALQGGGTHIGSLTLTAASSVLAIQANTFNFFGSINPPAPGIIRVESTGTLNLTAAKTFHNLELIGGSATISGSDLTIDTHLLWTGGKFLGPGTTTLAGGATADTTSPVSTLNLDTRTFANAGTFNYDPAQNLVLDNSTFNNSGTFNYAGDGRVVGNSGTNAFNNSGTVTKTGGVGESDFYLPYNNTGGTTTNTLAVTSIAFGAGGSLSGGALTTTVANAMLDFPAATFTISSGSITGAGTARISGADVVNNSSSLSIPDLQLLTGSLTANATTTIANLTWDGGTIQGNNTVSIASGDITGSDNTFTSGTVTLSFTSSMDFGGTSNTLTLGGGTQLRVESGANGALTNDGLIQGSGTFVSNGTTLKTAGAGTSEIAAPITASGSAIGATSGILKLTGGGTISTDINTGTNNRVLFDVGTFNWNGGSSASGSGTIEVAGGVVNVNNPINIAHFDLTGGAIGGAAVAMTVDNGTWSGGDLGGSGGSFILSSGGTFAVTGAAGRSLGRAVTNSGTWTLQTGGANAIAMADGITFLNLGTFTLLDDSGIDCVCSGTPGTLANNATVNKSGGTGTSLFTIAFDNSGTVTVPTGTLFLDGGGNHLTGSFTATAPGTIHFCGTSETFSNSVTVNGTGAILFSPTSSTVDGTVSLTGTGQLSILGGTNAFNGTTTTPSLIIDGGDIAGSGAFTISGGATASDWRGNTIGGSGPFTVASGATLHMSGATSAMVLDARTLTNDGTLLYDSTTNELSLINGAQITNNNIFNVASDVNLNAALLPALLTAGTPSPNAAAVSNLIVNNGTFSRSSGTANITLTPGFLNAGTATFSTGTTTFAIGYNQSAGTTDLAGGNIAVPNGLTLNGGTLKGTGTLDGALTNNATVAPGASPGTLTINGNYTQGSAGILNTELNGTTPGTLYDQLVVNGAATLDGTLNVTLGYTPANGDTFDVLTFSSRTGDFATKNLPTFGPNGSITASYTPTALQLLAVAPVSDLAVSQTDSGPAHTSETVTFNVTVSNIGNDPAANAAVTLSFSGPAAFVSATPSTGSCTGTGPVTCNFGTLNNGSSATVTLVVTATGPGTISNQATVSTTTFDSNTANDNSTDNVAVAASADLTVAIADAADPVSAGASTTYTVTVTNNGPDSAANVTVPLNITNGTITSATGAPFTCSTTNCSATTLAPGSYPITVTVTAPAQAGTMTLASTLSSPTFDGNGANNSDSEATTVSALADVSIVKSNPAGAVVPGTNFTYSIVVTNNGPSDAANVVVTDPTPAGLTFVANSGGCTTPFPCSLGTLTSGQSVTINAQYAVPASATGSVNNTANVSTSTNDANATNDSSTVTTNFSPNADLAIAKSGPTSVIAGNTLTYTVTVTNNGPSNAANVSVADPLPANTTFVSNSGGCTSAYPCSLGTLTPGQSVSITSQYTVASSASGSISNTATVSSTTADSTTANNSAAATTPVVQKADLSIVKVGPSSATPGTNVIYSISVTNNGPSDASGVVVSDPTPANLTFVSNSGACTTPFPCNLGTLTSGQSKTIASTWTVSTNAGGQTVTNNATVSATTTDPSAGNNSASASTTITCNNAAPTTFSPANNATNVPTSGVLTWNATTATSYDVYLGTAGLGGCATLVGTTSTNSFAYSGLAEGEKYEWRIVGKLAGCPDATTNCIVFTTASSCQATAPVLIAPANGATVGSPVTFEWTPVPAATSYTVYVSDPDAHAIGTTTATTLTTEVSTKAKSWFVIADAPGCGTLQSAIFNFTICAQPNAPLARVVGEATTGQTYSVEWDQVEFATSYQVEEADNRDFNGAHVFTTTATSLPFRHEVTAPAGFWYRVRAIGPCGTSDASLVVRAVVIPLPPKGQQNPSVNVPAGSKQVIVQQVFVPGEEGQTFAFTATTDRPWLTVTPTSGLLPPDGITLDVSADPSELPNGTFTATVIVTLTSQTTGRLGTNDTKTKTTPVTINLVTPVTPATTKPTPPTNALIIPSIGHLDGINSHWQSDIRLSNTGATPRKYVLTFTPSAGTSAGVKSTVVTVDPGATTALEDIVKNWYGIGSLGDSANGALEIRPLDNDTSKLSAIASSRTYNVTTNGTLGQYIPALPFGNFITKAAQGGIPTVLSLQQIAQSSAYRTNVGLVEASGSPATALLTVYSKSGAKLLDLPVELKGGEQRQLNSLLAEHNITVDDGRIEVKVTGGDGKITAYASVVDNDSLDPLLVSGVPLVQNGNSRYVLPGVADLVNPLANWRTDMRIFNPGTSTQAAKLTFYPSGGGAPLSTDITVNAGEVQTLDGVLATVFHTTNAGGAVHVDTPTPANLIVTGRTFNQTASGTFGQFIPAVTAADAVGDNERALHIQQVEDSPRYRTNIGLAEVTGKPARVEIQIILPDSKITPRLEVPLAGNEFRQFRIIGDTGLGNVYNARVVVRVIEGAGRVAAYGSIIDMQTQDPTYVPAQ